MRCFSLCFRFSFNFAIFLSFRYLACRDGILKTMLFSRRRQIGRQQRADKLCAAGWLFALISGCGAPILMSVRQNTYQCFADRMVFTRGPGKFCVKRSCRGKVGFSWSIFWSNFGFVGSPKFGRGFRVDGRCNQPQHPGGVFERLGDCSSWSDFLTFLVRMVVGFWSDFFFEFRIFQVWRRGPARRSV